MSFVLPCPHCGPRPVDEFAYFGEVTSRPEPGSTLRELTDYVYFRDNVAGPQREWWQHREGCGEDQQHVVLVADFAQHLEVTRRWNDQPLDVHNRLDNHRRDRLRLFAPNHFLELQHARNLALR